MIYFILKGMRYLHSNKIIHRDIKLENFLVGQEIEQIKLIDFGMAVHSNTNLVIVDDYIGTYIIVAPEIIQKQHFD